MVLRGLLDPSYETVGQDTRRSIDRVRQRGEEQFEGGGSDGKGKEEGKKR